jgi:thiol-disulfide isomerase/thioredoxin
MPATRVPRPAVLAAAAALAVASLATLAPSRAALAATPAATTAAPAPTVPAHEAGANQIQWLDVNAESDVDKAFAAARAQKKPVLLYWGARWCPPCNQLKATLFNRQDFIERTHSVVAVHLDGDVPAAQKLGTRFKVRGYPTLILFSPDGAELTRLPGEADASQVLQVLQIGMASGRPIKTVLADARAGKALPATDWRLLAFYSWDTDEDALVPEKERATVLSRLAASCPASEPEAGTRLLLKSLVESEDGKGVKVDAATRDRVLALFADPAASRSHMDVLTNSGTDLVKALAPQPGPDRQKLVAALDASLQRLQADATLSRADRMSALYARVDLAKLDQKDDKHPTLPPALVAEVRAAAHAADVEIHDPYERQAVITEAGSLLAEAGLWKESDALLESSLSKSHSPYYLMSELGSNARQQGRNADALKWYQMAFDKSDGPATRLQWGASYLAALVDLSPQDAARIEKVASTLITEAGTQTDAFYERSGRSMKKVGDKLVKWNAGGHHADTLKRLQAQLDGVCAKIPAGDPQKAACSSMLKPAPGTKA